VAGQAAARPGGERGSSRALRGMVTVEPPHARRRWSVVDASVWVSRFVPGDLNHDASRGWLHHHLASGNVIVVPTLLLVEVAGAIARRTGDAARTERIIQLTRSLSGLRWVPLTAGLTDRAANLATELGLRGADAIYVALADRLDIPLVTWDSEQLTRANPRIRVGTPTTT